MLVTDINCIQTPTKQSLYVFEIENKTTKRKKKYLQNITYKYGRRASDRERKKDGKFHFHEEFMHWKYNQN